MSLVYAIMDLVGKRLSLSDDQKVIHMTKEDALVVYELNCSQKGLEEFKEKISSEADKKKELLLEYPTVYLMNWGKNREYEVYVGETTDIIRRTLEHLSGARNGQNDWHALLGKNQSKMFVIGHDHFNKSLTLDIESKMMLYMSSVERVKKVHNRRTNQQKKYYTWMELEAIFSKIWERLGQYNPELFPLESVVKEAAIFKASPFHKLTDEQERAKQEILEKVRRALKSDETGQIIMISGEAGTGKTVLNSNIFYELNANCGETPGERIESYLVVNHDEQLTVYKQIADKLDLCQENKEIVCKPTAFINHHSVNEPVDVVLVDEAHLLWTQGKQSYRGKNQLKDIMERAKVVIVMFDQKQILRTEQYWENQMIEELERQAKKRDNYIVLKNQFRMQVDIETIEWIRDFVDRQEIRPIPHDTKGYEINIFDTPAQLQEEIQNRSENPGTSLSRIVATFDWEYIDKKPPHYQKYWEVAIGGWKMPWNKQIKTDRKAQKRNKKLSWAEQEHTIYEVGSTYTIQGFDLNYVGVILGPSVKYRDGKIVFDPSCSKNKKAVQNRTLSDGTKQNFAQTLLRNEINVLLTRGVNGLYIYAQDEELREALKHAKRH